MTAQKRVHNPDLKRARILEAAADLFLERGFAAVSMRDIAQAADVPQSLIHHYFGAKEALWQAVKDHFYAGYLAAQQALLDDADADFATFVDQSLRRRFRFFQDNPQVVKLLLWLQLMEDPLGMETGQQTGRRLVERIRQAQADGLMRRDIEPENAAAIAIALTSHWFQNRHVIRQMADFSDADTASADRRFLEALVKVLADGLHLQLEPTKGGQ